MKIHAPTRADLKRMAMWAVIFAVIAQSISSFTYQRIEQPQRRMQLLESIQGQLDAAEGRLSDLQRQGLTLQQQNNELQQLSVCLLQLIKGGDFTDREECQKKVEQFERNNGAITSSGSLAKPQPQPNPTPAPETQTQQPPQQQRNVIQRVGDFLGGIL